jgi:hypothetical protein
MDISEYTVFLKSLEYVNISYFDHGMKNQAAKAIYFE